MKVIDVIRCSTFCLIILVWGLYHGKKDVMQRYVILRLISPLFAISPLCGTTFSLFMSRWLQNKKNNNWSLMASDPLKRTCYRGTWFCVSYHSCSQYHHCTELFFSVHEQEDANDRFHVPGGRLNIKMLSYQYRVPHVKDKTVSPTVLSLTWESPYLGKTVFILRRGPGVENAV